MTYKSVHALNTISGKVGVVPESYLTSPAFADILVEVPDGTKDYDPEFWKPTTAKEHREKPTTRNKMTRKKEDVEDTPALDSESTIPWVPESYAEPTSD